MAMDSRPDPISGVLAVMDRLFSVNLSFTEFALSLVI